MSLIPDFRKRFSSEIALIVMYIRYQKLDAGYTAEDTGLRSYAVPKETGARLSALMQSAKP
jgi:hypothetical protein